MKLRLLVLLIEKLFGIVSDQDGNRADMYLPDKLLAMALVFLLGGVGCGIYAIFDFKIWVVIVAALGIILGFFAVICWKNQTIHVISDTQFTYTTMFGKTHTYNFSEIEGLVRNPDSVTLFVAGKKVHIESMAILSERLVNLINHQLENQD